MPHLSINRAALVALVAVLAACSHAAKPTHGNVVITAAQEPIRVATTFSTLNSFVEGVGGDRVVVQNIVPVGASPETFQPAPQDVAKIADAKLVVENGAGIDRWIDGMMSAASSPNAHLLVLSADLPIQQNNPHLWMDPVLAKSYVLKIRDALAAIDPAHKTEYERNAARYNGELDALTASIRARIDTIPPSKRYMIVFHNAWLYYNNRFGITTLGFVERNPGQEPNPQQIARLIDLAKQHHVGAVFSEPEYSPKLLYSIAQGAGVKVVENLYDDSVGTNPDVADYISMLTYDTNQIVKAMK
jgi:ABC-type Zn uptake system ZnuABC Zn-binding protein ZnuA